MATLIIPIIVNVICQILNVHTHLLHSIVPYRSVNNRAGEVGMLFACTIITPIQTPTSILVDSFNA